MRKYLMTGVAAIALCAAFTSCSKGDELYDADAAKGISTEQAIAKVYDNYNQAFIKTFGQPAANQDWGFGSNAKTRSAYPNGNMWADEGWNVPPVISPAQKNIVRQYFQQNPIKQYNDPGWSNFWIQQVYKGGSNTTGSQTTESYTIGNGDAVVGGDHMDHLCSKSASGTEDHVNDFNNSDNNDWEGRMLMVNSSTNSFGYINSNATAIHYDKASLVNWRVIAQWAVSKGLESSVESSVLNDGWNRSYMGFDWEQALPDDCYRPQYDWAHADYSVQPAIIPILGYDTFEFEGNTYRLLSANSNQYAYDQTETTFGGKKNYNDRPDNATIRQLLSLGYLPYSDTLKDWIKLSTGADGYYSDWIVTLTEAEQGTTPPPSDWEFRVIAEDLNAVALDAEQAKDGLTDSDWDFNDVVFDAKWKDNTTATIKVKVVGGVLPLYIGNAANPRLKEVHELFGATKNSEGLYSILGERDDAQEFDVTGLSKSLNGKDIVISVVRPLSTGEEALLELKADKSLPAAKIRVKTSFKPCAERQDIRKKYELFTDWVTSNPEITWY